MIIKNKIFCCSRKLFMLLFKLYDKQNNSLYKCCKTTHKAFIFCQLDIKTIVIENRICYIRTLFSSSWQGMNHPEADPWHSSSRLPWVTKEILVIELPHLSEGHSTLRLIVNDHFLPVLVFNSSDDANVMHHA